jgi:hypothetical protein
LVPCLASLGARVAKIDMAQIDVEELMNRFQIVEGEGSDP